jgi:insulysin
MTDNIQSNNSISQLINKSSNDYRDYEYFKLNNELKVIVVTDKLSKLCGALLNINVGSIHDTSPGMAHFLEHMVFMGSEKYPDENNFMDSVSKNGGITNAMTADTDTTYYFGIGSNKYLSVLDMFSWFFIKPLLRKDGIEREVNAVDSEAKKNLLDDMWIFQEMIKTTMNQNHPINHFTCGNKDTLKGEDLRERVKDFFNKYYSSNIMHLILFVNNDIDKIVLMNQIKDTFGKIDNKNVQLNKKYGDILNPNNFIKYIPNKDIDSLSICFEVPTLTDNILYSPYHILEWILSSKAKNSLFKIYESNGFIIESVFGDMFYYDDKILYFYKIILTENANTDKNIYKIIEIFFDYIKSISRSDKLKIIYDTILIRDRRDFNIPKHENVIDTMMNFHHLLTKNINPINLLDYDLHRPTFEIIEPFIKKMFENIKIYNSCIIHSSHKFKLTNPQEHDIFKTKYLIKPIQSIKFNNNIYDIIDKNIYITDDVNIIQGKDYFPLSNPEIINNKYIFSYNFNSSFKTPYVYIYVSLEIPNLLNSPDIYAQTMLFLDSIYSANSDIISELEDAEFSINISLSSNILYISIKGDNNKILEIIDIFKSIYSSSDNKSFDSTKNKLYKIYNSFEKEQPFKKIGNLISKSILNTFYTPYDLLPHLNKTFEQCKDTYIKNSKTGQTTIIVSGNIDKDTSIQIADKLYSYLNIENELTNDLKSNLKEIKYPYIQKYKNKNKKEKNNLFTLIYKITNDKKGTENWYNNVAFVILLNAITSNQYFNALRTKEQLGYIVNTKIIYIGRNNYKICGLRFLVQSPSKDNEFLFKRTQNFIKDELYIYIKNLTKEDLEEYKTGEISGLLEKFNNLEELNFYICVQIFDRGLIFDYKNELIKYIKTFDNTKFIEYYEKLILNSNKYMMIGIDAN